MKKIIMAMMIGLVVASYGAVNVNWTAGSGFYWDGSMNALLSPGQSTVAQLMYSPDAVKDDIGLNGLGAVNDTLLATFSVSYDDTPAFPGYAYFDAGTYVSPTFNAGYVYALVFQDNVINGGDWYFYTPMLALKNLAEGDPVQSIQINTDLDNGNAINAGPTVAQVVPEPATFLLVGIGGIASLILRRMRAF